jgi:hypothetical protein
MPLQPHTMYILLAINPPLGDLRVRTLATVTYKEVDGQPQEVRVRMTEVNHQTGYLRANTVTRKRSESQPLEMSVMDRDVRVDVTH